MMGSRRRWVVLILAAACGETPALGTDATSTSTGEVASTNASMTSTATIPGPASTISSTATGDESSDDAPASDFIMSPDGEPHRPFPCDLFEQDCARGEKCMPWANDGGPVFNATRCVPVAPNPAGVGEPCTVEDYGASGIDDCDIGSMCWDLDSDGEGGCVQICGGTARAPECPPDHQCVQNGAATLVLCRALCDPLTDDCGAGVCVPMGDGFVCWGTAAPPGATHGTTCTFTNECPAGTLCVDPDVHTECASNIGCCSTVCNLSGVEDPCPDLDAGQVCTPWFPPGQAPSGYDDLGVCALPR